MKEVGRFNVYIYPECNIDVDGSKYHLMDLSEWDGDNQLKQNFLYIHDESYKKALYFTEQESFLEQLINKLRNSKISIEEKSFIKTL